ncbi:MAG: hypothetical protein HY266_06750 [Deltaproteobacteria bacterium]|nr:hypothetical protein [Deltaproteobacteria bacterium]
MLCIPTTSFSDTSDPENNPLPIHGYAQQETAYRLTEPNELTKVKQILQIGFDHRFNETAKIKISGRFFYDAIFDLTNNFSDRVRHDQETEAVFRETYLDLSFGESNLTLGKQQIVWGEVPGLFFADIATAKDYREFFLPSFEYIRIPHWAEQKPAMSIENSSAGIRWSTLISGWNPALFYLYKYDTLPTYFRSVEAGPVIVLTPGHTRINQIGYTVSKDFDVLVLKSEGVATTGKMFQTKDITSGQGVVKKDYLEYVIGAEFSPDILQTTVNLQFYQRIILNHDTSLMDPAADSGAAIWLKPKFFSHSINPELLFVYDFTNQDCMFRPKVILTLSNSWLISIGSDLFGGDKNGLFGQFSKKGRVYTELRYNF